MTGFGSQQVAVKMHKDAEHKEILAEAIILDRCRSHPHLVQFIDIFEKDSKQYFVFEHAGLALSHMLDPLPGVALVRSMVRQVNEALSFLHGMSIIHCDLKPPNVLVASTAGAWHCRLADVGSALEALSTLSPPLPILVQTI